MKKRLIALFMTLCVAAALVVPAAAGEMDTIEKKERIENVFVEDRTEGLETVKVIDRAEKIENGDSFFAGDRANYDSIRRELVAVGVEEEIVSDMEEWYLLEYARSPEVIYSQLYCEVDEDGTITPVSKETAQVRAATESYPYSSQTAYVRLDYLVNRCGANGLYGFRTEVNWLTAPTFLRGHDYIGSSSSLMIVQNTTRTGWVKYTKNRHGTTGEIISSQPDITVNITDKKNANDGGYYYGSAGGFDLPKDRYHQGGTPVETYTNIRAAYYYQTKVINYTQPQNLGITASYLHQIYGITVTPSLVIDTGGFSGSIGVSLATGYQRMVNISKIFTYRP